MKFQHLLIPLLCSSAVIATFWTVTLKVQISSSFYHPLKGAGYTKSTSQTARRDAVPTNEPTSTRTVEGGNVTIVYIYYEYGTFDDDEIQEPYDYRNKTVTRYAISTTYIPAASCTTNFTAVTTLDVNPPSYVTPLLTPTKLISETLTDGTVTVRAFVEAASMTTPSIDGLFQRQVANCRRPNSTIVLPEAPDSGAAKFGRRAPDEAALAVCVLTIAMLLYLG
ncbi:hypothetical protein ACLOAV_009984 [Pseudogymnoascus australis]